MPVIFWWKNHVKKTTLAFYHNCNDCIFVCHYCIIINNKYPPNETDEEMRRMDEEEFVDLANDFDFHTRESFGGDYYEGFSDSFTTPNGEEVVAFGYYGNDY